MIVSLVTNGLLVYGLATGGLIQTSTEPVVVSPLISHVDAQACEIAWDFIEPQACQLATPFIIQEGDGLDVDPRKARLVP